MESSVKYCEGKIVFNPMEGCNKKSVQNRTLSDGSRQKFGGVLLRHEVRILMTRGVEGILFMRMTLNYRKHSFEQRIDKS